MDLLTTVTVIRYYMNYSSQDTKTVTTIRPTLFLSKSNSLMFFYDDENFCFMNEIFYDIWKDTCLFNNQMFQYNPNIKLQSKQFIKLEYITSNLDTRLVPVKNNSNSIRNLIQGSVLIYDDGSKRVTVTLNFTLHSAKWIKEIGNPLGYTDRELLRKFERCFPTDSDSSDHKSIPSNLPLSAKVALISVWCVNGVLWPIVIIYFFKDKYEKHMEKIKEQVKKYSKTTNQFPLKSPN
ncbi:hypothetical protein RF11_15773 [Thelohanellus kitauei]|uniref:Uncharacterized protein n=1 Tax=Thelohanellus kitauei TaxID=669202 RepID=A0A0C2J1M8_THEKT|nr:hypothetical protein RF11_15773 [Thelohanellus kitauei]